MITGKTLLLDHKSDQTKHEGFEVKSKGSRTHGKRIFTRDKTFNTATPKTDIPNKWVEGDFYAKKPGRNTIWRHQQVHTTKGNKVQCNATGGCYLQAQDVPRWSLDQRS